MTDITWSKGAVDLLARTIWGEARGEGARGMQAVANVVMNRVYHPKWWGHDVISVCLQAGQFSCWNKNDPNLVKVQTIEADDPVFITAQEIAAEAIAGTLPDITNGATTYKESHWPWPHIWGPEIPPQIVVGKHSFYTLPPLPKEWNAPLSA